MFDLKKYRGVIFHDAEEWCKIWRNTDLWKKWQEYGKFSPEHLKVSKLGLWWDPLIESRNYMILIKTYIGVMCHDNEEWCKIWRRIDLPFQTWHEEFKRILIRALESLKYFHFNVLLLSKVYIIWAKKVQRSYLSWNWRGIKNLEMNRLAVSKLT